MVDRLRGSKKIRSVTSFADPDFQGITLIDRVSFAVEMSITEPGTEMQSMVFIMISRYPIAAGTAVRLVENKTLRIG